MQFGSGPRSSNTHSTADAVITSAQHQWYSEKFACPVVLACSKASFSPLTPILQVPQRRVKLAVFVNWRALFACTMHQVNYKACLIDPREVGDRALTSSGFLLMHALVCSNYTCIWQALHRRQSRSNVALFSQRHDTSQAS